MVLERINSNVRIIMTIKDVLASCLVISLGIILIVHFALFWVYGGVFIYENNKFILLVETLMSLAILGFGIERLMNSTNFKKGSEIPHIYYNRVGIRNNKRQATSHSPLNSEREAISATMDTAMPEANNPLMHPTVGLEGSRFFNPQDFTLDKLITASRLRDAKLRANTGIETFSK